MIQSVGFEAERVGLRHVSGGGGSARWLGVPSFHQTCPIRSRDDKFPGVDPTSATMLTWGKVAILSNLKQFPRVEMEGRVGISSRLRRPT